MQDEGSIVGMAHIVSTHDWSQTPLGHATQWPHPLRTAVEGCLTSPLPVVVWWGSDLSAVYNDAYALLLGDRHPGALGHPAKKTWPSSHTELERIKSAGVPLVKDRVLLQTSKDGQSRERYFACSTTPILHDGEVAGLFQAYLHTGEDSEQTRLQEQARTILESITDAFFAVGEDWKLTYVNSQAAQLLGRSVAELQGQVLWNAFPGLSGSEFEILYRTTMRERTTGALTAFYPDSNRWYEVHTYPGLVSGISIYFSDVSAGLRSEELSHQNAALLRAISDSTVDVIFAKDRAGRMQYANPAALALIGKPLEQVLHKTDAEFLDDNAAAQFVMANDRKIMESGVPAAVEEIVPLPDGTKRVWLSRKTPNRDLAGRVIGLFGVSSDVTAQRQATDRIHRLYDVAAALSQAVEMEDVARVTVHQAIVAIGASAGSLALINEDKTHLQIVDSMGFAPEVIASWTRFPLDAQVPLAEAARRGEPVFTESPEARLAAFPSLASLDAVAGTRSSACIPLCIGTQCIGALGLSFDHAGAFSTEDREHMMSIARQCVQAIERARLFAAERRARAEAERASQMKDDFLATISHELRTPLNAILGWASILAEKTSDDELRGGLERIVRNARSQGQIIEDLLDMSRIISGKTRLHVQRTDLLEVIQSAIESVQPTADAKGVRLRAVLDPQAGPVSGDAGRLQQVLWNLLTNALKFTPRGGQVEVLLERVNSHIEISVADTGEGISKEFLPQVFDRFRQADASTTRQHGGLGLGLSIVKQLVELHGGTARAKSPGLGRGSTFIINLPLTVLHPESGTETSERHHPAANGRIPTLDEGLSLDGVRVLVVDDERDAREMVKLVLENRNANVRMAASAQEALAMIEAEPPDVLVSDIGMPGEDGYSLIRHVRSLGRDNGSAVPAVALTAYARTEDRVRAIREGFQTHVAKPVEPAELVAVVASLAGRTR